MLMARAEKAITDAATINSSRISRPQTQMFVLKANRSSSKTQVLS